MSYTILSWNLEHMRHAKLHRNKNPQNFARVVKRADIAFFYESKTQCHTTAANIMNDEDENVPKRYQWVGESFVCHGSDSECVVCVYRTNSVSHVGRNVLLQKQVNSVLKTGQRPPVLLDLGFRGGLDLVVAPWHAAGPAANLAQDLFVKVKQIQGIDLIFGDFNWQAPLDPEIPSDPFPDQGEDDGNGKQEVGDNGPVGGKRKFGDEGVRRSKRIKENYFLFETLELDGANQPVNRTSTFTANGDTNRNSPLDRCLAEKSIYRDIEIEFDRFDNCVAEMRDLTNHYPLFIHIN